ncbi:hypothetical protein [Qipengyuania flava]|uniref:hypothetical protein n=1 Tax=Qipengyuania flava TaxID=192812 RepID=UPI0012FD5BB7|nr:hypothetical protein [Qipengyuania flava]
MIGALYDASDWADLFEVHQAYVLSPAQVQESIERLAKVGYVERDGLHARLTGEGRAWVISSRRSLFMSPLKDWRQFEVEDRIVSENEPYLPNLQKLDKDFFVNRGKI